MLIFHHARERKSIEIFDIQNGKDCDHRVLMERAIIASVMNRKIFWRKVLLSKIFSQMILIISIILGFGIFNMISRSVPRELNDENILTVDYETKAPVPNLPWFYSGSPVPELPSVINFQPVIESWASRVSGMKSVMIYDLDLDMAVGSLNADQNYDTASIYKLFVAYEGYRRIEKGIWRAEEMVTGRTREKCLDLMLRESDSICAERFFTEIGRTNFDKIVMNDFGIKNSQISKLSSNAKDVVELMKLFYKHADFSDVTVAKIQDAMLNQSCAKSEMCVGGCCDWRQGLPRGFSKRARVYNKVGWSYNGETWDTYHDAAIVQFPEKQRSFAVVVMTKHVASSQIAALGRAIEATFFEAKP